MSKFIKNLRDSLHTTVETTKARLKIADFYISSGKRIEHLVTTIPVYQDDTIVLATTSYLPNYPNAAYIPSTGKIFVNEGFLHLPVTFQQAMISHEDFIARSGYQSNLSTLPGEILGFGRGLQMKLAADQYVFHLGHPIREALLAMTAEHKNGQTRAVKIRLQALEKLERIRGKV